MTLIAFNQNIPNPPNNPSSDVPLMQSNTNSEFSIWAVDHFTFNNNNSGWHQQNTYPVFSTPSSPSSIGPEASVAYPSPGIADASHAQYYFQNALATFPLSAIKAFGVFVPSEIPPVLTNGFNIASTGFSAGTYTFTLNTNVVSGNNVAVLITNSRLNINANWTFSNPILSITNPAGNCSFLVLQI